MSIWNMKTLLLLVCLMGVCDSCVTHTHYSEPGPVEEVTIMPTASQRFIQQGYKLMQDGTYESATYKFERALDLDPDNGEIYFHLAGLKLKQERPLEAIQFAKRGLRFARSDKDLRFRFYVILSVSYERLGETEKSLAARAKADAL